MKSHKMLLAYHFAIGRFVLPSFLLVSSVTMVNKSVVPECFLGSGSAIPGCVLNH